MFKSLERKQMISTAENYAQLLQEMLTKTNNQINDIIFETETQYNNDELTVINEMQQWLLNTRPTLFKYASEAAEAQDAELGEILSLNDSINKALQLYDNRIKNKPNIDDIPSMSSRISNTSDLKTTIPEDVDLLSILTPATTRKEYKKVTEITDLDDIFEPRFKPSTSLEANSIINQLESLKFEQMNSIKHIQTDKFRLEDTPSSVSELIISSLVNLNINNNRIQL